MNQLEKTIMEQSPLIKDSTLKCMRAGYPFQYMINLSKVGATDYDVPAYDSFWFGVDKSLDWYNAHKRYSGDNLQTEFYALKQGAEWMLRYIFYNSPQNQDLPE